MTMSSGALNLPLHDNPLVEIVDGELFRYQDQLRTTLDTLCLNPIFRNSPKSCEFIRHVVLLSLEGKSDELKERLIGMSLLKRDASYDTSTDSGVRVRANDVRKRLVKFNEGDGAAEEFCIVLPTGTYVPRFFRTSVAQTQLHPSIDSETSETSAIRQDIPEYSPESLPNPPSQLSLFQLAVPTLATIFLCIICMRWQLSQENLFTNFWHEIFQGDQAFLCLTPPQVLGKQDMVTVQNLNEVGPLLDLVAQFHRKFTVVSDPRQTLASNQMSVYVGLDSGSELQSLGLGMLNSAERFHIIGNTGRRTVVDSRSWTQAGFHHAALLTIVNGSRRSIYIDGTDDEAVRSLVNRLCNQTSFPAALAESFRPGTITQAVFPIETYAKGIFDQQPIPPGISQDVAALERLP